MNIKFFFINLWCYLVHGSGKKHLDYINKCEKEADEARSQMIRYEKENPDCYTDKKKYIEHMKLQMRWGAAVDKSCRASGYYDEFPNSGFNHHIMQDLMKDHIQDGSRNCHD